MSETSSVGPLRGLEPYSACWRNVYLDIDGAFVKLGAESVDGGSADVLLTPDQAVVLAGRLRAAADEVRAGYASAHRVEAAREQ